MNFNFLKKKVKVGIFGIKKAEPAIPAPMQAEGKPFRFVRLYSALQPESVHNSICRGPDGPVYIRRIVDFLPKRGDLGVVQFRS